MPAKPIRFFQLHQLPVPRENRHLDLLMHLPLKWLSFQRSNIYEQMEVVTQSTHLLNTFTACCTA